MLRSQNLQQSQLFQQSQIQLVDKSYVSRKYSDDEDDEDDEEEIEFAQIEYNRLVLEAYQSFQAKDLNNCIRFYQSALALMQKSKDYERQALIKANLAVVLFHNCEYRKAAVLLEESLELVKASNSGLKKSDAKSFLLVKIYANLCIVNIVLNKYQESKEANDQALLAIINSNPTFKIELIQELIFIYYRFTSFVQMQDGYFEGVESKYDGATLACFYSSMGLNKELFQDYQASYNYHKKALERWQQVQEPGFIVLALRHLISLTEKLQLPFTETQQYLSMLNEQLKHEDFKGVNYETLFKDFDKKLSCASDITNAVTKLEEKILLQDKNGESLKAQSLIGMSQNLNSSALLGVSTINNVNEYGEPLWKQAVKLRLCSSIRYSKNIGADQMKYTLQILQDDNHPLIQRQIVQQPFTKEAVNNLKAAVNQIKKFMNRLYFKEAFDTIYEIGVEIQNFQELERSQMIEQSKIIRTKGNAQQLKMAFQYIMVGDYLTKINKNTNDHLAEVRGLVYGKCTDVLRKGFNKKLQSWLCFSLILKSRTLDFYCDEEQIMWWVRGLSQGIKRSNKNAYVLRPGQFYWRKMKLILYHYFIDPFQAKNKNLRYTFTKALIAFKRNGCQLPIKNK